MLPIEGSNPTEGKYFNILLLKSQGKSRIIKQKSLNEKLGKIPLWDSNPRQLVYKIDGYLSRQNIKG